MLETKRIAMKLKQGGFTLAEAHDYMQYLATVKEVVDEDQGLLQVETVYKQTSDGTLSERLNDYISLTQGYFSVTDCDRELQCVTRQEKANRRQILHRLVEANTLERHRDKNGWYRKLETELEETDWQSASDKIVALKFPFGLEEYAKIYPKSIVIVTGGKNQGKTAFLLNVVINNMNDFPLDLFNSETGREQLKKKFDNFGIEIPNPPPFKTYQRYDNFADVIDENRISVIDYMDVGSETIRVGDEIEGIFRKLKTGVAIIGLQKPPGSTVFVKGVKKYIERDLAYGGSFSSKRAILYVSISEHKLKLLYVKEPAKAGVNPNNMQWSFKISKGVEFTDIKLMDSGNYDEDE